MVMYYLPSFTMFLIFKFYFHFRGRMCDHLLHILFLILCNYILCFSRFVTLEKNAHKEQEKEKRLRKNKEAIREMPDNMKHNNIRIIGIPERQEEEQGIENLFEKVMMENFSNLRREKVTQIQEPQRVPSKRNPKHPLQDTS